MFAHLVINILFIPIVKYSVKVYTPNSVARSDYRWTVKIEGRGEQKTADHTLPYESTQDTKRFDMCSFLCLSCSGSPPAGSSDQSSFHTFSWLKFVALDRFYVAYVWKSPGNFPRYFPNFEL